MSKSTTTRIFGVEDRKASAVASKKTVTEVTKSKTAARAYLVKLGTHTPAGKVSKTYGG